MEIVPGVGFASQNPEEQARLAMEIFYLILRPSGAEWWQHLGRCCHHGAPE